MLALSASYVGLHLICRALPGVAVVLACCGRGAQAQVAPAPSARNWNAPDRPLLAQLQPGAPTNLGASGGAPQHTLAPPSATGRPPLPPMSVATQPGHTLFTSTPVPDSSAASWRVNAFSAALDAL